MIFTFYQMISCTPRLETGFNWITYRIPKVGSRIIFQPSTFPRVSTRCWLPFREGVLITPRSEKTQTLHYWNWDIHPSNHQNKGMFWKHWKNVCWKIIAPICPGNCLVVFKETRKKVVPGAQLLHQTNRQKKSFEQERTSPIHLCNLCSHDVGPTTPTQNKAPQKIHQKICP